MALQIGKGSVFFAPRKTCRAKVGRGNLPKPQDEKGKKTMRMKANQSALIVVDLQERLIPAIHEGGRVIANARILMQAANRLDVPTLISEQYSKGLGHSVPDIAELAEVESTLEKMHFSCLSDSEIERRLRELGRKQAVVCGTEAHVCVLQSVLELIELGYQVFVVEDAVSSRTPESKRIAMTRMQAAGVQAVTTEMVVFEWLEKAGTPEFKELSALIK